MPTDRLKFDLWMAMNTSQMRSDWFTAQLFRLIMKADRMNIRLIARGFPREVACFEAWRDAPDEDEFYGEAITSRGRTERDSE